MGFDVTSLLTVAGTAIVVGVILQAAKAYLSDRFIPLIGMGTGIVLSTVTYVLLNLAGITPAGLEGAVLTGFLGGSSACGFYEAQKNTVGLAK